MPNYKLRAVLLGEKYKTLRSVKDIEKVASAVFSFPCHDHPNDAITSRRAKAVYDWIMTLGEQPLSDVEKEELLLEFESALHSFPFEELPPEEKEVATGATLKGVIHPEIGRVAGALFNGGHYADAALAAMREVNSRVKGMVKGKLAADVDGADLMHQAFSPKKPIIVLDDLSTESGRNIQQGYMEIFAGAMMGIRNPKAHANITISRERGLHFLVLASLLMHKLDESLQAKATALRPIYEKHNDRSAWDWPEEKQCQCGECKDFRSAARLL